MHIEKNALSPQRWIAFITAGIMFLLMMFHMAGSIWYFLICGLAFFLGMTDFGRQCPLLLSIHYLFARIHKKKIDQPE